MSEEITSIFFGVMSADMLDDGRYDEAKSTAAFAEMAADKLRRIYKGAEFFGVMSADMLDDD